MLNTVVKAIDTLNGFIAKLVSWLLVGLVLVTFSIVVLRYLFDIGSIALQESTTYMHGFVFMLAIAYTLKIDGHVRVDIFYQRFGVKGQALVNLFGSLLLLMPVCGYIIFISWDYVSASWSYYEGSREAGGIDAVFLLKSTIPAMAGLLFLQGIAEALKAIKQLLAKQQVAS